MSFWTQVNATFEFDNYYMDEHKEDNKTKMFDDIFGKAVTYTDFTNAIDDGSYDTLWADMENNPDKYLPCGSEGTLKKFVYTRKLSNGSKEYLVKVCGGLRDFWDDEPIKKWFKRVCSSKAIETAYIRIELEGISPIFVVYEEGFDEEIQDSDFFEYIMLDPKGERT